MRSHIQIRIYFRIQFDQRTNPDQQCFRGSDQLNIQKSGSAVLWLTTKSRNQCCGRKRCFSRGKANERREALVQGRLSMVRHEKGPDPIFLIGCGSNLICVFVSERSQQQRPNPESSKKIRIRILPCVY